MNKRKKRVRKGKKISIWLKIPVVLIVIIVLSFVGVRNKLYFKSVLQKYPVIFKVLQKGENVVSDLWAKKVKHKRLKEKPKTVNILVDAAEVLEKYEKFWGGFGHDQFYSGVKLPRNREFFKLIKEINWDQQAFTFYRSHNIFSDLETSSSRNCGGRVYSEDEQGKPQFDWRRVDEVFDTILAANMKPILEFGFMPSELASDPKRIGDWRKANVSPPKDYNKWKQLVYKTVKHLQERYGAEEIESWYFEVWNEPDLWHHFWVPNPKNKNKTNLAEYYKLYDYTVAGATAANPNIKIGGPAIAGWTYVLEGFLKHVRKDRNKVTGNTGTKIDFYSFHKYGDIEEKLLKLTKLYVDIALFVDKEHFSKTPFLIDEFGPAGTRWKESWKNTPYVAAWICKAVDGMFNLGEKYGKAYRPASMVYWGAIGENYRGGSGALATVLGGDADNIVKGPVFNVYHLLSYLGSERIAMKGGEFGDYVHGLATKHENESIEVVLYHIDEHYRDNFRETDSVQVNLTIENLTNQKYFVRYYLIDGAHSNAYRLWKKMGSPNYPSRQQIAMLQKSDDLQLAQPIRQIRPQNGTWYMSFPMEANSVSLVVLTRVTDEIEPLAPNKLSVNKITTNSISFSWQPPKLAQDNDGAMAYIIYRNGKFLVNTEENFFVDDGLIDDTSYSYRIYSVDDQGNLSGPSLNGNFRTLKDNKPPEIVSFIMTHPNSILITFDEPLQRSSVSSVGNFSIDNGIMIKSVLLEKGGKRLLLSTTPHQKAKQYTLTMRNIKDLAKNPNELINFKWQYEFHLSFADAFKKNTANQYVTHFPDKKKNKGKIRYDGNYERLQLLSGDNKEITISHVLPAATKGEFNMSFMPMIKYPDGGAVTLKLMENELTYYAISNTDGYGPGKVEKYIRGKLVEKRNFSKQYVQNREYSFKIRFSPEEIIVNVFGQRIKLNGSQDTINVNKFIFTCSQQDAYINNIYYRTE